MCQDLARQYNLLLAIPSVPQMRAQICAGLVVSPMRQFFIAVGFPPDVADQAENEYQRQFAARYQPRAFAGVPEMLLSLHQAGLPLGLVTANIRENVAPALRLSMDLFDTRCLFFWQPGMATITKSAAFAFEWLSWPYIQRQDDGPFMTTPAPITASERDSQALTHVRELHKFFAELRSKNFDFFLILLGAASGAVIAPDPQVVRFCAAVAAAIICVVFFGLDTRTIDDRRRPT
jgi:hypothetical protein